MFGTLLGPLPRPARRSDSPAAAATIDDLVREAIEAQVAAGLEPVTDGGLRHPDPFAPASAAEAGAGLVDDWRFAAGCTDTMVKQALPGPYTVARRLAGTAPPGDRDALAVDIGRGLRTVVEGLVEAGCRYIEVHEPDATLIGEDPGERRRFIAAHAALLDGVQGPHLSLAITGGDADTAGAETILAPGYHSLAVDLIGGPDNWRLVTAAPGSMGVVCGALTTRESADDGPEVLVWATRYAASTGGRGLDRVGLATAGSLAHLSWDAAVARMERLGHAARVAGLPPGEELAGALDHRAQDLRTRAVGRRPPRGAVRSEDPPAQGG